MKKKKVVSKARKQKKPVTPKKKPIQKAAKVESEVIVGKPEFYRVELEVLTKNEQGVSQYSFVPSITHACVEEGEAQTTAQRLKSLGIGGRLVHLDGTPTGAITETWGSVERTAEAERLEQNALKPVGQN